MAIENTLWVQVLNRAEKLLSLVKDGTPKQESEIPAAHGYIMGMFWRARRLYDGILLLLRAEMPEEAAILGRSLFEESLILQELAADVRNRNALILGWANRSIDEKCGLLKVAKADGHESDITEALAHLEEQRRKMKDYATRHGVRNYERFQSVKDAAQKFGRKDDFWTYEWSHESVHGTDAAWMFARRKHADNSVTLYARTNDPKVLSALAHFAAKSLSNATEATFTIFGWTAIKELPGIISEMEDLLKLK